MLDNETAINKMNEVSSSNIQQITPDGSEAKKEAIKNDQEYRETHYLAFKKAAGGVADKLDETTGRMVNANSNNFNNMSRNISNAIITNYNMDSNPSKPLNMFVDGLLETTFR